jgi:DNA-directed RNA polymerase subunit H (RpoH/RPB5)
LLLCWNALIYYQYVYLTTQVQPEPVIEKITVDQETLQKVLENLTIREENLSRVKTKKYFDPFND